jgi:outer membrane protein assembly factor BamB
MIARAGDSKEYVQFLRKGLFGVDARTGKFLWRYDRTIDPAANMPTPVVVGQRIFSSGGRTGGGLIELKDDTVAVAAAEVYFERQLGAGIGGAVLVNGQLYGTQQQLFCADFATGKVNWSDRGVGPASICFADGRLYVRGHGNGDVVLVEPSAEGYREKGRFPQSDRSKSPAWPHPVVANGGLYLRDHDVLLCYDVKAP